MISTVHLPKLKTEYGSSPAAITPRVQEFKNLLTSALCSVLEWARCAYGLMMRSDIVSIPKHDVGSKRSLQHDFSFHSAWHEDHMRGVGAEMGVLPVQQLVRHCVAHHLVE